MDTQNGFERAIGGHGHECYMLNIRLSDSMLLFQQTSPVYEH